MLKSHFGLPISRLRLTTDVNRISELEPCLVISFEIVNNLAKDLLLVLASTINNCQFANYELTSEEAKY